MEECDSEACSFTTASSNTERGKVWSVYYYYYYAAGNAPYVSLIKTNRRRGKQSRD